METHSLLYDQSATSSDRFTEDSTGFVNEAAEMDYPVLSDQQITAPVSASTSMSSLNSELSHSSNESRSTPHAQLPGEHTISRATASTTLPKASKETSTLLKSTAAMRNGSRQKVEVKPSLHTRSFAVSLPKQVSNPSFLLFVCCSSHDQPLHNCIQTPSPMKDLQNLKTKNAFHDVPSRLHQTTTTRTLAKYVPPQVPSRTMDSDCTYFLSIFASLAHHLLPYLFLVVILEPYS